jgi:hypothetical protein
MDTYIDIFYKIYQIMDHYETILDNQSYNGNKYKPTEASDLFTNNDSFFSSIFKNVTLNKPVEPKKDQDDKENADKEISDEAEKDKPDEAEKERPEHVTQDKLPREIKPTTEHGKTVQKYIKKCYKILILRCHPDKHLDETNFDKTQIFIRCKEYYDNQLLIGLLYIFYLYKLSPPPPLITTSPMSSDVEYNMLLDQIIHEIRVIQDKLVELNSPLDENKT